MKLGLLTLALVACTANAPAFDARADHEEGHDRPCYIDGKLQPGWHQCQMQETDRCCPDGYSCGGDDFVSRPGVCRWWGLDGTRNGGDRHGR